MADSWEAHAGGAGGGNGGNNQNNQQAPPAASLNPAAASFSFNPSSAAFVPPQSGGGGGGYYQQQYPPQQQYQQYQRYPPQQQYHHQQQYQQQQHYQQQQFYHQQQQQQQFYHQHQQQASMGGGNDNGAGAAAAAEAAARMAAMRVSSTAAAGPSAAAAPAAAPAAPAPPAPKPKPAAATAAAAAAAPAPPKPKPAPTPTPPPPPPPPPAPAPAAPEPEPEPEEAIDEEAARAEAEATLALLDADDARDHLNVVFIGHVDAGKSTTGGQILFLTGGVDDRTIAKYEKEAKDKNRESWYMAYIMDTNDEERAKGKTVEVGRAHFATAKRRYTILDAPGHKNYVPNMIAGAAQADVGVLVIAARKGEFETGFERGGQTREHAQLAKTLGVAKLVVAVNKMDDPSVVNPGDGSWSQERYDEVVSGLTPFLKSCGYNTKRDVVFLPMSGLHGHNIKDPVPASMAPWYKGQTLFGVLDSVEMPPRDPLAPFRLSIIDKYRDMGTIVMGKSEAGLVKKGDRLLLMPNRTPVTVSALYRDDVEVAAARGGENLRLRLSGVDEDEVQAGFVLCSRRAPVPCVTYFDAQLQILDLLEHKAIFTAGYKAVLHVHSLVEECEISALLAKVDMKTREKVKAKFVKSGAVCIARVAVEKPICVELFDSVPQLGRFTLRDEGRTIAIGKIIRIPKKTTAGGGGGGGATASAGATAGASSANVAAAPAGAPSDDGGAGQ